MGVEIQMSGERRSAENRQAKRYRYRGDATVRRLESEPSLAGRILDLSVHGCLLRLPDLSDFHIGAPVDLAVNSTTVAFRALGSVRHISHTRRLLGVSFVNLTRRGETELQELIAELESAEHHGHDDAHKISVLHYEHPRDK